MPVSGNHVVNLDTLTSFHLKIPEQDVTLVDVRAIHGAYAHHVLYNLYKGIRPHNDNEKEKTGLG